MLERVLLVMLAGILTVTTLVSVAGHGPFAGPTLITITPTHGVDQGDVPIAALWVIGMVSLGVLWRKLP